MLKNLKIAQFHWGFPPIIGGVETHLALLMPMLQKKGHQVSLLTGSMNTKTYEERYKGVKVVRSPFMDLNWLAKRGLDGIEKDVKALYFNFLSTEKPDIIHTHNMHYFSKTHISLLEEFAKKNNIPLILTAHNAWDDDLFLELTTEIDWDHIISVSFFIENELLSIGCDHNKVTTVHHGIDETMFTPGVPTSEIYKKYPQLQNRKVIFHPARMGLSKGCDVSIKALRLVKEQFPDVMMVLAGSKNIVDWGMQQQKDISYIRHLVDKFKLWDNVLIDSFTIEEMPSLYKACDVCIYPSTAYEPFGLTMLEANATAKPIIVTGIGGMPEIIKNGINGFVIPPKSSEELASRILQLLRDETQARRLGTTGRRIVEREYTKEDVTNSTLEIYEKCLADKKCFSSSSTV